jgi:hypothetical protein
MYITDRLRAIRSEAPRFFVKNPEDAHRHLRDRIVAVALVTLAVDAVAGLVVFLLERRAPNTEITNLGDAYFWTSTQLLTVSSQLGHPITTSARVLDVALQAYAITVVATLAGLFAHFFHQRQDKPHPDVPEASPGDSRDS